jgi:hypothetical protein
MSDNSAGCLAGIGVALVVGIVAVDTYASTWYNDRWRICTVVDKDRGASSDGSSHYRIYTRDCGVLADSDDWMRGKTNSADIWAQIQKGHIYNLHVTGYRLGLTSSFPNILDVRDVTPR